MPELALLINSKYNASGAQQAKRDMSELGSAGESAASKMRNAFANTIQDIGKVGMALTPLSLGLGAIGVAGIKGMAEFSQTLENTRVIVNATGTDMEALKQQALDLGASSVFSATEVAKAQKELGKAGLDTQAIIGALPGVLNLAAAGQVDMATAASLTTSVLNSFGLEASESARVADLLAGAANASLADISDLGQGVQQAGFAFAEANWGIEDLATSLAILTDRGLTGSDAGTALKNAWTRMINPTEQAKDVMDALGISFFTAEGTMKGLPDIIGNLNRATSGLTEEQRANALSTIFLSDGYKALAPLLDEGVEGFAEVKRQVTEVGAAQKVADANMRGLAGAFEYISGSIDSALKAAFLPWEEMMASSIVSIADFISSLGRLPDPVLKAAVAFGAVLAVAGPLMAALPFIAGAFAALATPIGAVVVAVGLLAAAWAADFGGIRGITMDVINSLQPALVRLGEYLNMIKAGDWSGLQNAVFSDVGSLLQKASAAIEAFSWSDWIADVLDWATYIGKLAWAGFITVLEWATYVGAIAWDAFIAALTWTSDIVGKVDWKAFISNLGDWGTFVGKIAWGTFIDVLRWTSDIVGAVDWGTYITKLTEWSTAVGTVAWDTFIAALEWTSDIVGAVDWTAFITKLTDWSTAVGTVVWSNFITALKWGADIVGSVDWGTYITSLDWGTIITTAIDWATYIPALGWNLYVAVLDWATIISAFVWSEWITKLTWPKSLSDFDWTTWISGVLDWATYIGEFTWDSFVSKLEWPLVAKFDWGNYISKIDWGNIVTKVTDWGTYITSLDWGAILTTTVEWGTYITALSWDTFITALTDWGTWITSLDWTTIITTAIDWATWIPALTWNSFVKAVTWTTFISVLAWTELIKKIDWATWIPAVLNWIDYVSKLDWGTWISNALDWGTYIAAFAWDSFVSKLEWPEIPGVDWSTWIPDLTWPDMPFDGWSTWVPNLTWPDMSFDGWSTWIDQLSWPAMPFDGWSTWISKLSWPSITWPGWSSWIPPFPGWPNIRSMVQSAINGMVGRESASYDSPGTTSSGSIGGRSAALVAPPVFAASGGGGRSAAAGDTFIINNNGPVASDIDMRKLALGVVDEIQRRR